MVQDQSSATHALREQVAAALEAERHRLAGLLQSKVIEPLGLLLAQANIYEQSLTTDPSTHMALSVLVSLARQVLQQTRDLAADLHPVVLETLGLEPALETLAAQVTRIHGLRVSLSLQRLPERLPPPVEVALFRVAQDVLDRAVCQAHASQVTICLTQHAGQMHFSLSDDGLAALAADELLPCRQRIEQLGGAAQISVGSQGGLELRIGLTTRPAMQLTPREIEVVQLLTQGLSNKAIAHSLSISPRTVNFHLDNIYSKMGVGSRTEAALVALRQGWVRPKTTDPG
ncbi:MAG: LuxR C-terminal-related transcriptional regulator [Chloroflexota bacterium]